METKKRPGTKVPGSLSIDPIREDGLIELLGAYRSWRPRALDDPRTAPLAKVAEGLVEIAKAEGPVLDHRARRIYTRAAGLSRAGSAVVARYDQAIRLATRKLGLVAEPDAPGSDCLVLSAAGQSRVQVRERGDRTIEEVPLAEISALIRKLELDRGEAYASPEERFRRVLEFYELLRLTATTRARLELARERARLPEWSRAITATHEPDGPPAPQARPRRTGRRLRHG